MIEFDYFTHISTKNIFSKCNQFVTQIRFKGCIVPIDSFETTEMLQRKNVGFGDLGMNIAEWREMFFDRRKSFNHASS